MATVDELQKDHEARLDTFLAGMTGKGGESDWALARALVHRAVHLTAARKSAEFCAIATFLAEMVGHAHQLMHSGGDPAKAHHDVVH